MILTSWKGCASGADDNRAGTVAITNPNNVTTNSIYATATVNNTVTHYLKALFDGIFTSADIPAGATINQIAFRITRKSTGNSFDQSIVIVKAGTPGGTDQSAALAWNLSDRVDVFSPGNNWGLTFAQADILANGFGVELQWTSDVISNSSVKFFEAQVGYTPAASSNGMTTYDDWPGAGPQNPRNFQSNPMGFTVVPPVIVGAKIAYDDWPGRGPQNPANFSPPLLSYSIPPPPTPIGSITFNYWPGRGPSRIGQFTSFNANQGRSSPAPVPPGDAEQQDRIWIGIGLGI